MMVVLTQVQVLLEILEVRCENYAIPLNYSTANCQDKTLEIVSVLYNTCVKFYRMQGPESHTMMMMTLTQVEVLLYSATRNIEELSTATVAFNGPFVMPSTKWPDRNITMV